MEKLYFATTNKGKFRTMQRYFEKMGAPFKLEQTLLDLVEIQSDNMGEIAVAKAAEAQAQLQEPVIVDDSGLFIEALNGFPGAYSKHAEQTLGAKGILKLLEGQENRNCIFQLIRRPTSSRNSVNLTRLIEFTAILSTLKRGSKKKSSKLSNQTEILVEDPLALRDNKQYA